MASPTSRTLALLREVHPDAMIEIVEHWNPYARRRQDLFGVFDLLCCCVGSSVIDYVDGRIIGIQVTTTGNMSSRIKKMTGPMASSTLAWLKSGGQVEVWGWSKRGPRGGKKVWTQKVVRIERDLDDTLKVIHAG